eukprot:403357546
MLQSCENAYDTTTFRNKDQRDSILENGDSSEQLFLWTPCLTNNSDNLTLSIKSLKDPIQARINVYVHHLNLFNFVCSPSVLQPESRTFHGLTQQADGTVWVFGGMNNKNITLGDFWKLDTQTMNWEHFSQTQLLGMSNSPQEGYPEARYGHVMAAYYDYLIVFGGANSKLELMNDLWIYSIQKNIWVQIPHNINEPRRIVHATANLIEPENKLIIFNGKSSNGAINEIWELDLELAIQYSENPLKQLNKTHIWKEIFPEGSTSQKRFGHSTIYLFPNNILIFGGITENQQIASDIQLYSLSDNKIINVKKKFTITGEFPEIRAFTSMVHQTNGYIALYGGQNQQGQLYKDYWHLRLDLSNNQIEAQLIQKDQEDLIEQIFMSRDGQKIIQTERYQYPILFGSSNKDYFIDSSDILQFKDERCQSQQELDQMNCLPCPEGSVFSSNQCVFCGKESYWFPDLSSPFASRCDLCPEGTEKIPLKQYGCSPCQAGTYYKNQSARCEPCGPDEICPVASANAYPLEMYQQFQKTVHKNDPPLYQNTSQLMVQVNHLLEEQLLLLTIQVLQFWFQVSLPFDLCELSQSQINLTNSYHYDQNKMKIKCKQIEYDELDKIQFKRPRAQSLIYQIRVICEDCVKKDPSNSFIEISLGELSEFEKQSFYVHFFQWEFNSIWSKEVDEEDNCEGCSKVIGFTTPETPDQLYNPNESFRGEQPTIVNVLLTPTFYQNMVDEIELSGYRAHLQNIEKGETINLREALKIDMNTMKQNIGHPQANDVFKIKFQMNLSSNIYQIRVIQLKNILEALAEVMGFLAGFSFLARFSKHILVSNKVGRAYDRMIEDHLQKVQQLKNEQMQAISYSVQSSPRKNVPNIQTSKQQSLQREVSTSPLKFRPKAASDYDANFMFGLRKNDEESQQMKRESSTKKKSKFLVMSPVHNDESRNKASNQSQQVQKEEGFMQADNQIKPYNKQLGSFGDEEIDDEFKYFYGDLRQM